MARGRRDYTWGVLQDAILPGRYSVNWFDSRLVVLESAEDARIYDYSVPAGYKLFLTGLFITCSSPQINLIYIIKDMETIFSNYFTLNFHADFASLGSYIFETGEDFEIYGVNFDSIDVPFRIHAFGVLEQLV